MLVASAGYAPWDNFKGELSDQFIFQICFLWMCNFWLPFAKVALWSITNLLSPWLIRIAGAPREQGILVLSVHKFSILPLINWAVIFFKKGIFFFYYFHMDFVPQAGLVAQAGFALDPPASTSGVLGLSSGLISPTLLTAPVLWKWIFSTLYYWHLKWFSS